MKQLLKNLAYRFGLLSVYHRFRNRDRLTVAMFHRVLPATDVRYSSADPEWTMTLQSFADCLTFFRRHYHVVSPQEVFSSMRGQTTLPRRSLLVTFDDGWADTAQYAQPVLDKLGVSALVFVAGSAINEAAPFWEERVYGFLATRIDGIQQLRKCLADQAIELPLPPKSKLSEPEIRSVIAALGRLDGASLEVVTAMLDIGAPPAMLDAAELSGLLKGGHAIGGHGMTHRPLTRVDDVAAELANAQLAISSYLAGQVIDSMSFPHGAYSETVVSASRATGYRYLFSSDAHLNPLNIHANSRQPVGRIHISERAITDSTGHFQPALLATWMFLRPHLHREEGRSA